MQTDIGYDKLSIPWEFEKRNPDGTMEKDVPADRSDLLELERRLKQPMEIDYVEFSDDR